MQQMKTQEHQKVNRIGCRKQNETQSGHAHRASMEIRTDISKIVQRQEHGQTDKLKFHEAKGIK
jgi:hypothetical protein